MEQTPTRVERYLHHLDALSGGVEPQFNRTQSRSSGSAKLYRF